MKELHFEKVGKLLVATEGDYRFVLHSLPPEAAVLRWTAELHKRNAPARAKPIVTQRFGSKSAAIEWLARFRGQVMEGQVNG